MAPIYYSTLHVWVCLLLMRPFSVFLLARFTMPFLVLPAEEEWRCEDAGEEGEVEGEEGGQAAEKGRRGGRGGRGECPASGGSPGERLPSSCPARAGEDERAAAEEDLLQEEQNGQCVFF